MQRLINDAEFQRFVETATTPEWGLAIEAVMRQSPYGEFGDSHAVYLYSSRVFHPDFEDEEPLLPTDRNYWNAPNRCDWTTPIFLTIAQQGLPEYQFKQYRKFRKVNNGGPYDGQDFGHTDAIGTCPETGDAVALGFNVNELSTFDLCGYPNDPIDSDAGTEEVYAMALEKLKGPTLDQERKMNGYRTTERA